MTTKKDQILDKTIEVLGRDGLHTSLKVVADELGCAESLIYRYYESNDNIKALCFRLICREIISNLQSIPFPEETTDEKIIAYIRKLWISYFAYLRDNPLKKRYYLLYTLTGHQFPEGYSSPKDVVSKILKENYTKFKALSGFDIEFISEYMISIANTVALAINNEWYSNHFDAPEKLFDMMIYGVFNVLGQK